ncbi:MAG: hypothetical protein ACYDH9_14065 [Limisphaerales bacterium]
MPTVVLRRFTNADTLRQIGGRYLIEVLSPYGEFLQRRGFALPSSVEAGVVDHERLAAILMTPDTDMPKELADALFSIHELATVEGMDKLQEAAEQRGLNLGLNGEAAPADVAVRVWLLDRALFKDVEVQHHLTRPKAFVHFLGSGKESGGFNPPTPATLAAMESRMDDWFERKRRGRGCRVFAYARDGECWFMVRHGEPCRREGSLLEEGEPSSVFYRPQQHDILVYVPARKEIRIHAGTKGERELYRKCFGQHLFGDEDFFPGEGKYTLAPLARDGSASLNCLDVEGIEWVRLREIEMLWGGGVNAEREIRKSADLFASFESRGYRLKEEDNLRRAVFSVKFADARTARNVTITPPNRARYERDDDSAVLEALLWKRGFIVGAGLVAD